MYSLILAKFGGLDVYLLIFIKLCFRFYKRHRGDEQETMTKLKYYFAHIVNGVSFEYKSSPSENHCSFSTISIKLIRTCSCIFSHRIFGLFQMDLRYSSINNTGFTISIRLAGFFIAKVKPLANLHKNQVPCRVFV